MIRVYVSKVAPGEYVAHCPEAGIEREWFVSTEAKAHAKGLELVTNHVRKVLRDLEQQEV